ncbi:MAG TPA: response regulator [Chloroflexota bacterium]|nr:response regulator [Chloroflexota bacterium]
MAKILVVDDAAFMRLRLSRLLTSQGYEAVEAENGLDAIAKYKEHRPDGVLLDITMPEMDGLTALKELLKADANAKVVMVTGMGQQSMVMEAMKSGAKDFVIKPYRDDRILAALLKILS